MKQKFILICLLAISYSGITQSAIDELIQAEKNFAAFSVANSTKEAFLKFLDSNGIVFDKGKPVNGIEVWSKREKRTGILNWYPLYAEIASSGDFGYTTGPWTFQPTRMKDSVIARGQYITVWHKDNKGEWKFLVDLGVNNTPELFENEVNKIERTDVGFSPGDESSLISTERQFIKAVNNAKKDGYKKYMSAMSCILNRNNARPATDNENRDKIINSSPDKIEYTINGSAVSSSGDLGFVYGSTVINEKTDNYLRIWRKETEGWKIAVEVLLY